MTKEHIALQIFLKRTTGGFVNNTTKPGFASEMRAAFELAELFLEVAEKLKEVSSKLPEPEL